MLLLLLLVGFGRLLETISGMAEKSVLIIGGDKNGTIEQFFPSNMTSRLIGAIKFPAEQPQSDRAAQFKTFVQVTPVNATHIFVLQPFEKQSFFMNRTGHLTPGAFVGRRLVPGLTSMPGDTGQMIPIFCGGYAYDDDEDGFDRKTNDCYVLSADGQQLRRHKSMLVRREYFSLTAFGNQLVAIDGEDDENSRERHGERFNGYEWVKTKRSPLRRFNSVAVKLNETSLLSCGVRRNKQRCMVYHVDTDSWLDLKMDMKSQSSRGEDTEAQASIEDVKLQGEDMILLGQTIYAFGGDVSGGSKTIQTLDISGGVEAAQWKIENAKMVKSRVYFGVWVIDSEDTSKEPKGVGQKFNSTTLFVAIAIVGGLFALLFVLHAHQNQNAPTSSDETRLYVDSAEFDGENAVVLG